MRLFYAEEPQPQAGELYKAVLSRFFAAISAFWTRGMGAK
jgi:hypothetical protein